MRHQLDFWANPWRPAQDRFNLSPVFDMLDTDEGTRTHIPACEVEEQKEHFLITLDVPGVTKEDIKIHVENGRLIVSAERKKMRTEEKDNRLFSERRYGKFERVFELGEHVDPDKIDAAYQDGVLKIALGKAEQAKPREIAVKSEVKGGLFDRIAATAHKVVQ